jgi:3-oxoacid CoA-transferase subunit B
MAHCSRNGEPKILNECSFPLTGKGVVNIIVTELALISVEDGRLVLRELAPGISEEEVREKTGAPLTVAQDIREMFTMA